MTAIRPASPTLLLASTPASSSHQRFRGLLVLGFTTGGHVVSVLVILHFAKLHAYIQASYRLTVDLQQLGTHLLGYFNSVKIACYVAAAFHSATLLYASYDGVCLWLCPTRRVSSSQMRPSFKTIRTNEKLHIKEHEKRRFWRQLYVWLTRTFATYHAELTQFRLLIEVIMQTYQANKMSNLVATVWLNRVLVIVIVFNCWFTPLIYTLMHRQSPHERRLVRLSVDTTLDITYNFGIPYAIIIPYVRDFVPALGSFPLTFYIMDTWTTVAGSELQQLFVFSWWDFVSKVSPWFFFCYRLHSLRRLTAQGTQSFEGDDEGITRRTRVSRLLNSSLLIWGLGVLFAHLQTAFVANTASSLGCLVEMRPWFQTTYTCAVIELSCSQQRIIGAKHEVSAVFSEFTADRVQSLIVSHCPLFAMPPSVLSFSSIAMLKFYNTTISDWGADAMLTAATNPNLQQFFVIETNFSSFPEGLLSPQMPKTMRDVKFVATNLTTLPTALTVAWSSVKYFTVERTATMTDFPEVLASMPETLYVAFPYGGLRVLAATTLRNLKVWYISVEGNPLTTLPEDFGNIDRILQLNVKKTNLSELPVSWQWLQRETRMAILADGTPLCEKLQAGHADPPPRFAIGILDITCNDTVYQGGGYPIALEQSWREANRYPLS